ncbi:hypothetical protein I311_02577 [Cryptococcus gattii NT-10]|nr:hypothetical protein I311_02577 [Cryptococcus gattii NT-10]
MEGELMAARENGDWGGEKQTEKMTQKRDKQIKQFHDIYAIFNPHQGGDPSLRTSTEDPNFAAIITEGLVGPVGPSTSNLCSGTKAPSMARYDYHLENGSPGHTDDVAFGGEDDGDSQDDDEDDDRDAREDIEREEDDSTDLAAITSTARGRRADLTELHSTLMTMEDRGLNEKRQFHKEITELKAATLCLEREQFAEDKVRRDREEQALEEHRRMERRAKEEEMELSAKEEEMECRRREVSAKEEESIHSSILRIAQFVLPCVSGDPVEAYKKAVTMYESQRRQRGEDNNS